MDLPETYVEGFHNDKEIRKLTYARLGDTDLKLSKLGVGGASLGNLFGTVTMDEGNTLVKKAIKSGVNYVDTSPYYGNTYSETLIGNALVGVPREAYHISTKVGRYGTSWADYFDHSAERIVNEFEKSLERLGLDYVDILFVHDIEFSPLQQILTESLPAVQSLVEKKKARYIGVSGYPVSVLKEAVEKSPVKVDVVLSYARDCLIDNTMKSYYSFFKSKNVGLINASVTACGLLSNEGPPDWHPASVQTKQLCKKAGLFCQEQGVELGNLAIYYAMQNSNYSSHLVGMKKQRELEDNLNVAVNGLSQKEAQVLDQVKQMYFNSGNHNWEGVEIAELQKYRDSIKEKK